MNKKLYEMMDWAEMEAITYAEADEPKRLLGARSIKKNLTLLQAYYPEAEKMMISIEGQKYVEMDQADEAGFFAMLLKEDYPFLYTLKAVFEDGKSIEYTDPYSFGQIISKKDLKLFNEGNMLNAYDILGAKLTDVGGIKGCLFSVWAPNAIRVSVVGDFNFWDGRVHQMQRLSDSGVFEIFIPGVSAGALYKFEIKLRDGSIYLRPDPYGKRFQKSPDDASIVIDESAYKWNDKKLKTELKKYDASKKPVLVYEVDLGEFVKKHETANCKDIAAMLIKHIKKYGYTHVQFMPVMENGGDSYKKYDTTGYFAIDSSIGNDVDFKELIDKLHSEGIGVILEVNFDHFPDNDNMMKGFDGSCLYEHADRRRGYNPKYGTLLYNYGRPEVSSFLISVAGYYIKEYHIDGLKLSISSMLYLDYDKNDGEWLPNIYGGKENLEAIEFIKRLNTTVHKNFPGVLMIAMDDTAWFDVTKDVTDGGLGFDIKWNNGFVNDLREYCKYPLLERGAHYGELCFPLVYAFNEKYMLNLSHETFADGPFSIVDSMPGSLDEKYSGLRTMLGYYMMHPGKKLIYMGADELTEEMSSFFADIFKLYLDSDNLYEMDFEESGFEWINCISANESIIVFMRKNKANGKIYIVLCNFLNAPRNNYKIGVPGPCKVKEIFNSDDEKYGGFGFVNTKEKLSKGEECDGFDDSVKIKVPPLGMCVFEYLPLED